MSARVGGLPLHESEGVKACSAGGDLSEYDDGAALVAWEPPLLHGKMSLRRPVSSNERYIGSFSCGTGRVNGTGKAVDTGWQPLTLI